MLKIYSTKEASSILKVSEQSLRLWEHSGKLVPRRTTLNRSNYTESDLCQFLNLPMEEVKN
jgi:DNA-binding transcriptional MerR regulator